MLNTLFAVSHHLMQLNHPYLVGQSNSASCATRRRRRNYMIQRNVPAVVAMSYQGIIWSTFSTCSSWQQFFEGDT